MLGFGRVDTCVGFSNVLYAQFLHCSHLQRNARVATYMKALQKIEDANGGASDAAAGNDGDTAKTKNKKHCKEFPLVFKVICSVYPLSSVHIDVVLQQAQMYSLYQLFGSSIKHSSNQLHSLVY